MGRSRLALRLLACLTGAIVLPLVRIGSFLDGSPDEPREYSAVFVSAFVMPACWRATGIKEVRMYNHPEKAGGADQI